ncbi:hypothetical protein D9M70_606660 [compost metagenome]
MKYATPELARKSAMSTGLKTQRKDSRTSTKLNIASTTTPKARRIPMPLASAGTMEKMCCQRGKL